MFTACSSSDDDGGGQSGGGDVPGPVTSIAISGVVTSVSGPVSGVKVSAGTASDITGQNGMFYLENAGGSVVKFEKDGYATITRAFSADKNYFDVYMTEYDVRILSATSPQTVNPYYSNMQVDLPASYTDEKGNAYNGTNVTVKSVYLDPNTNVDFASAMPGNLAAIRSNNSEAELVSYGMVAVELTGDNGEKLQLGAPATLTFPVDPTKMKFTPSDGDTMPLWSFNEETGLWEEEGEATYKASLQAYVGTVTHFSWHNLDYPSSRATLNVKVVDANGTSLPNILVDYDGQRKVYTNAQGIATCTVPSDTPMLIQIPSESYCNYAGIPAVETKIVKQDGVTLTAGATQTITLTMPASSKISGKVTNESGSPQVCALWIEYDSYNSTSSVTSSQSGEYSIYAPYGYTGTAKIVVFCGDGYQEKTVINLDGTDQTVDITVNRGRTETGVIYVKGEGMNMTFDLNAPESGVFENAVSINGNRLDVSIWGGQHDPTKTGIGHMNFDLSIPEYDETKTSFMGTLYLRWAVWRTYSEDWYHVASTRQRKDDTPVAYIPIEVTKNSDIYTFKVNNADCFYGVESHSDKEPVETPVKVTTTFSAK